MPSSNIIVFTFNISFLFTIYVHYFNFIFMKPDEGCTDVFLTQAAELKNLLFWEYCCTSGQTKFFGKPEFLQQLPLPDGNKDFFPAYTEMVCPDQQEEFSRIVSGQLPESSGTLVYRILSGESARYHQCSYDRVSTPQGDVIAGTITDTSVQIKLQEQETIFRYISQYSNIGIYSWNPISDKSEISQKWYENLGLPEGLSFIDSMKQMISMIHPDDLERVKAAVLTLREGKKEYLDEEFRVITGDTVKWLKYTAVVKSYDPQNKVIQVVGMNQDITNLKQQEERHRKILEVLPDFIFIFDEQFVFRDVLKSERIKLFHTEKELIGQNGRMFFAPDVSDLYCSAIRRCLNSGDLVEIEYFLDAQKGRHYYQARIMPFESNKVLALIHDITPRMKRTQELLAAKQKAEEADRMKSAFLANMSHEIRTPLNAIVGFSELVAHTDDAADKEMYLDIIRHNSNILLQLINDVLDLSRIESGKTKMELQDVEICALGEEVRQVHLLKMKPGVVLKYEHPEQEIWLHSDQNKIIQVLFNFMSNAIKNTQEGSITLRIGIDYSMVRITVADTGCGIPAEQLQVIFERFTKLNNFVQGTGLGLSICQTIADKLGGRIEVESTYGEGSAFSLLLPYLPDLRTKPQTETMQE